MIKNPPFIKLNSFHFAVGPKSKPPATSPYEKNIEEGTVNETILKTKNKKSDVNRNLSDVFNNVSTKTKVNRPEKNRSLSEIDADFLFENFEDIFEFYQTSHEETYKQLQQAQSNTIIIKNLCNAFEDAAFFQQRNIDDSAYENRKKKHFDQRIEEAQKNYLNQSVNESNKAKLVASNEYYKNFLTKLTESHCEGCTCLNCKVFAVVSQNKKPKFSYDEGHKRMKTEIFQIKEEFLNLNEEKTFQQPTTYNMESEASILIRESLKNVSYNNKGGNKRNNESNQSLKVIRDEEIENCSFYCNSIDLPPKADIEKNESVYKSRNNKNNGDKRIMYKRKMGLPPLNKKNQSIIYQPNMFFKPNVSNNNNIKRSISTGVPKRII